MERNIYKIGKELFITNDEEIKEGNYFLYDGTEIRYKSNGTEYHGRDLCHISGNRRYPISKSKKIILTTDQSLDGVQDIDDEFLEWFVKNPSCEFVEVEKGKILNQGSYITGNIVTKDYYEIIIPKEEPNYNMKQEILIEMERLEKEKLKQETLEEAAEKYVEDFDLSFYDTVEEIPVKELGKKDFIEGAKWQSERMYSEEDMINFSEWVSIQYPNQRRFLTTNDKIGFYTTKELLGKWFKKFKK
jgi:hypothetical protein